MVTGVNGAVPRLDEIADANTRQAAKKALDYMDLPEGLPIRDIHVNKIFLGSCTNGRIEDLREGAKVARGYTVNSSIEQALVVPGSRQVKVPRPSRRASTRCSRTRDSSGASRAARCAWP
ncbi:MAG: aconitase family protein [Candidatus Hydrogenedentales bacterium]